MNKLAILCLATLLLPISLAHAELVREWVEYEHEGQRFEGYQVHDDALGGTRPGILVVHQWMGLGENERMRADMLAELGHVAFALDVYGKGIRPADSAAASEQAGLFYADRELFRERVTLGLEQLRRHPLVDPNRIAAIGYCFGGTGVLELARSGAELDGVVSFHGGLAPTAPEEARNIRTRILVCHGAVDPYVKPEEVRAFVEEMEGAGVDYQLVLYAGAVHAFTQKAAGDDPSKGAAYDARADRRSWQHMRGFLAEVLR